MKLSPNFTLEELTVSDTARRLGIPNTPIAVHMANMKVYLAPGLEAVRAIVRRPVRVNSAYRNPDVNRRVGGTPTSAHPMGYAADITVDGMTAEDLARVIAAAMKARTLKVDQLILESGRKVVHVSFDPRARGMRGHQPGAAGSPIDWGYFA